MSRTASLRQLEVPVELEGIACPEDVLRLGYKPLAATLAERLLYKDCVRGILRLSCVYRHHFRECCNGGRRIAVPAGNMGLENSKLVWLMLTGVLLCASACFGIPKGLRTLLRLSGGLGRKGSQRFREARNKFPSLGWLLLRMGISLRSALAALY